MKCIGCGVTMTVTASRDISANREQVTYLCLQCGTREIRTIKPDPSSIPSSKVVEQPVKKWWQFWRH